MNISYKFHFDRIANTKVIEDTPYRKTLAVLRAREQQTVLCQLSYAQCLVQGISESSQFAVLVSVSIRNVEIFDTFSGNIQRRSRGIRSELQRDRRCQVLATLCGYASGMNSLGRSVVGGARMRDCGVDIDILLTRPQTNLCPRRGTHVDGSASARRTCPQPGDD